MHTCSNVERVREGVGDKLGLLVQGCSNFCVGCAIAFYYSWQLTLVLLAVTPILMGFTALLGYVGAPNLSIYLSIYLCSPIPPSAALSLAHFLRHRRATAPHSPWR